MANNIMYYDSPIGRMVLVSDEEGLCGGVGRVLTLEPCTWKDGWPMLTDEKGNIPAEMQKPVLGYDGVSKGAHRRA